MNKTTLALIFGQTIGLGSTVFMLYVFLNEAFFGRGVYFYEPSIPMATAEFTVCLAGLLLQSVIALVTVWNASPTLPKKQKELEERTGYETGNKKVYQ